MLVKMECREGLFKELVENSSDVYIVTDKEFNIRYISSSVSMILKVQPVSVLGRSILDFVSAEMQESWRKKLIEAQEPFTSELEFRRGNAQAYFDVRVSRMFDRARFQGYVLQLYDITSKKLREEELIRSNQQLDQVIYKTTHDLRAPLMSALGLVKIAEKAPREEQGQYISMIKKSLLRLDSFIEDMNNFFRNEKLAVQREKISLSALLKEELSDLKNSYPDRNVNVLLEIKEDTEWFSDRVRVQTIITNILSNAIKYMDLQKQNPFVKIAAEVTDEHCDLCIEDNGIGIDQTYLDKIFELFFRATEQSQGTGLGLFIVKDTIDRLKGTIKVVSALGKGTMFTIRIPNQLHQQKLEIA
jgi:hypothetical protein